MFCKVKIIEIDMHKKSEQKLMQDQLQHNICLHISKKTPKKLGTTKTWIQNNAKWLKVSLDQQSVEEFWKLNAVLVIKNEVISQVRAWSLGHFAIQITHLCELHLHQFAFSLESYRHLRRVVKQYFCHYWHWLGDKQAILFHPQHWCYIQLLLSCWKQSE